VSRHFRTALPFGGARVAAFEPRHVPSLLYKSALPHGLVPLDAIDPARAFKLI